MVEKSVQGEYFLEGVIFHLLESFLTIPAESKWQYREEMADLHSPKIHWSQKWLWTRGSCVLVWKFPQPFVANQGAEVQRVLHDSSVVRYSIAVG